MGEINYEKIREIISEEIDKALTPVKEQTKEVHTCVFEKNGLRDWRLKVETTYEEKSKNKRDWKNNLISPALAGIVVALVTRYWK
jgi:hypothetical protein